MSPARRTSLHPERLHGFRQADELGGHFGDGMLKACAHATGPYSPQGPRIASRISGLVSSHKSTTAVRRWRVNRFSNSTVKRKLLVIRDSLGWSGFLFACSLAGWAVLCGQRDNAIHVVDLPHDCKISSEVACAHGGIAQPSFLLLP